MKNSNNYHAKEENRSPVGLYFGDYSFNSGLWEYWIPVLKKLSIQWVPFWDKSFQYDSTLRSISTLIVPGGFCWSGESAFGGNIGRQNLKQAIADGLNYVGVCYGANVAMSSGSEKDICHLGLVEGQTLSHESYSLQGNVYIDYLDNSLCHCVNSQKTIHINGRIFGKNAGEVVGRFSMKQPGPFTVHSQHSIAGLPAAIASKYGKGQVFLFSSHPEAPVSYQYPIVFEQIDRGKMSVDDAVNTCWSLPVISKNNMALLNRVFDKCDTNIDGNRLAEYHVNLPERVALLSSACELQRQYLMEIDNTIVRNLNHPVSPSLQFASEVMKRRLRQALYVLDRINLDALVSNPKVLETVSLPITLLQFGCMGDHTGLFEHCRHDYHVSLARQINSMKGNTRLQTEGELARLVIDKLDRIVNILQGCLR